MERRREAEKEKRQSAAERSENSTVSLVKTGRAELMKNDVRFPAACLAEREGERRLMRREGEGEREAFNRIWNGRRPQFSLLRLRSSVRDAAFFVTFFSSTEKKSSHRSLLLILLFFEETRTRRNERKNERRYRRHSELGKIAKKLI